MIGKDTPVNRSCAVTAPFPFKHSLFKNMFNQGRWLLFDRSVAMNASTINIRSLYFQKFLFLT